MKNAIFANLAILKGFIHAIALPLILTVISSNLFFGLAWIIFVSYLYSRVFINKPAAFYFFAYAKVEVAIFLIAILLILA